MSSASPLAGTRSRVLSAGARLLSSLRRNGPVRTVRKTLQSFAQKLRTKVPAEPGERHVESLPVTAAAALEGVELRALPVGVAALTEFARRARYPFFYYRDSRPSYLLWHYVGLELAAVGDGETVVDVGAQSGIWRGLVRQRAACRCYDLDLEFRPGVHGDRIGAGADAIPLPDGSVDAFVSFCAFNCFEGPADVGFAREAVRLLAPGGRLVIVPLCLGTTHVNLYDPAVCDREEAFDPGAARQAWPGWGNNFGRWYDPRALRERLLANLPGFTCTLHEIRHDVPGVSWPGPMYAAVFRKP